MPSERRLLSPRQLDGQLFNFDYELNVTPEKANAVLAAALEVRNDTASFRAKLEAALVAEGALPGTRVTEVDFAVPVLLPSSSLEQDDEDKAASGSMVVPFCLILLCCCGCAVLFNARAKANGQANATNQGVYNPQGIDDQGAVLEEVVEGDGRIFPWSKEACEQESPPQPGEAPDQPQDPVPQQVRPSQPDEALDELQDSSSSATRSLGIPLVEVVPQQVRPPQPDEALDEPQDSACSATSSPRSDGTCLSV